MTTDSTLLEAAARAAGLNVFWHEDLQRMVFFAGSAFRPTTWNPLTDDGDAFRLAVRLRINIEHMKTQGGEPFGINCWPAGRGDCAHSEDEDLTDYAAATRRAIVRAAAAMGERNG